ncbi:MAG: zf-HC2 domain-containing protein [Bacteroidota bacterium]
MNERKKTCDILSNIINRNNDAPTMKIQCKEINHYLFDYAEKNLDDKLREEISAHLQECKECHYRLIILEKALDVIENEKEIPDDPWFYNKLKARMENARVEEISTTPTTWPRVLQPVLVSAIIVIFAISGMLLGNTISRNFIFPAENLNRYEVIANDYYLNGIEEENIEIILLSD